MTPEETALSPDEIRTEDTNIDAAQELAALLTDPATELQPESQPEAEPKLEAAPQAEPIVEPQAAAQPVKPAAKPRWKPHILIRIPLQLLSFVISIALFATTLAGALVLDVQQLTSSGGITQLINTAMSILTGAPAHVTQPQPFISGVNDWTIHYDETDTGIFVNGSYSVIVDENGNTVIVDEEGNVVDSSSLGDFYIDENGNLILGDPDIDLDDFLGGGDLDIGLDDIPEDILNGGNTEAGVEGLIDWIYDQVADSAGEELPISKEQLQNFVADSSVSDFLGDKLAGFADDYINGTNNTTITADDLLGLLEENEEALKEHLQIELSPETKEEIHASLDQLVQDTGINEIIREEVFGAVDEMIQETTASIGVNMDDIRFLLQILTSEVMRWTVIGINAALLLLLCLLNFYNVPAGLTWAAFPCILSGSILSAPLFLLENMNFAGEGAQLVSMISSFTNIFKPIHFGLLAIGAGLMILSIVWRIIRASVRRAK